MRQLNLLIALILSGCLFSCGHPQARSEKSFDVIREMVKGKTAAEVERILGKPDTRQTMLLSGERWIWWNYTYLDGKDYPPEDRGQVVHLEIIFERTGESTEASDPPSSQLRTAEPFGVTYILASRQPA